MSSMHEHSADRDNIPATTTADEPQSTNTSNNKVVANCNSETTTRDDQQAKQSSVRHLTPEQASAHDLIENDVNKIIAKLTDKCNLTVTKLDSQPILDFNEVEFLITEGKKVISSQPVFLNLKAPVKIFGDLHGQYLDFLRWIDMLGSDIENSVFLGDYVDRGTNSIELMCLLIAFKLKYPLTVFLLRGNHEADTINRIYGFYDEVKKRYPKGQRMYKSFTELFNLLPLASIIDDKVFCCHGGLPRTLDFMSTISQISRPFNVPDSGPITDLLWADPDMDRDGFNPNERGVSYTFGKNEFKTFMDHFGFELMVRAHQVCEDGYEFFSAQNGVTIFSAPNYCGEFDNAAAILIIDKNLTCSFKLLTGSTPNARIQYRMPTNAQMKELEKRIECSSSSNAAAAAGSEKNVV